MFIYAFVSELYAFVLRDKYPSYSDLISHDYGLDIESFLPLDVNENTRERARGSFIYTFAFLFCYYYVRFCFVFVSLYVCINLRLEQHTVNNLGCFLI